MTTQKPSVGRIVLFTAKQNGTLLSEPEEVPAIITRVHGDCCVNLHVFRDGVPAGSAMHVLYSEDIAKSGLLMAWRWPPKV